MKLNSKGMIDEPNCCKTGPELNMQINLEHTVIYIVLAYLSFYFLGITTLTATYFSVKIDNITYPLSRFKSRGEQHNLSTDIIPHFNVNSPH